MSLCSRRSVYKSTILYFLRELLVTREQLVVMELLAPR